MSCAAQCFVFTVFRFNNVFQCLIPAEYFFKLGVVVLVVLCVCFEFFLFDFSNVADKFAPVFLSVSESEPGRSLVRAELVS